MLILSISKTIVSQTYNFKNYNTEQGLAQSQVLDIFQDKDGNMWFTTNGGGVSKFNGEKFFNYNTNNGLTSNFAFSIVQNENNEILIGCDNGLTSIKGNQVKKYTKVNTEPLPQVFKLFFRNNITWLGTEKGVFQYSNQKITFFNGDSLLNNSTVFTLYIDNKNNVWFGTTQNGVIRYNPSNHTFKQFSKNEGIYENFILSITQTENDNILIGTTGGLNIINNKDEISAGNFIPDQFLMGFRSLLSKTSKGLWLGSASEGLYQYNDKKITIYNLKNGLTNNSILSLFEDREKNIWIGTDGVGVYKYSGDKFTTYSNQNGFVENYINTVAQDKLGNYWIGLRNHGLTKINGSQLTNYTANFKTKSSLPDNNVNFILPTTNGQLFFGTSQGLSLYDNETFKTITGVNFQEKYILALFEDSKQNVWVGTTDGLYKYYNGIITEVPQINKFKDADVPLSIYNISEDISGNIIISTTNGLFKYGEKSNEKLSELKALVYNSFRDYKNNMWFGTEEGLYLYNNIKFEKIKDPENRLTNLINFIQQDNYKRLIIGTNSGVEILNLEDYYKGQINVKHFGKEDGLISLESNFNASYKDKDGRILIGTTNGLEIYDPKNDITNPVEAITKISAVKLFFGQEDVFKYAQTIDSTDVLPINLELPFNKNHLTFHFIGISLTAPEKVMYQYKLEGVDDDWTPPTSKTEATYSSLQPGHYTFMVKAMNNDGVWNKEPIIYEFEILAPWYKTWWFYSICVIGLVGGIVLYNYVKTKKLIADKQKLEQVVDIRTRELRAEKEKVESINKEVIEQKTIIEHKNIEITDSIKYAKNIQEALLPNLNDIDKLFKNNFVLYMPKDIVSGDFYWFAKNGDTHFVAAVDCTGHGVPGAFMSIVGNTLLNKIVNEEKITTPGDILLELHKGVKIALHQSNQESERRDGMDITLCAFTKGTNVVQYAGANRPLWIYRKNNNYDLEIIKATKYPIGGLELEENRIYQNHEIEVTEGDCLYLFSDGYADQFGGPKGKKFMLTNLQKTISEIVELPMSLQKQKLAEAFNNWKQDTEQIDDVLVIGVKI